MKFFTNKQAGVKVTPIFENEAYESKLLEYTKERELFSGKLNEVYANLPFNGEKEILLGLGKKEELVEDKVREVFFKLVKVLESNKELEVFITLPKVESVSTEKLVNAAVEGALHATYKFDKYKSDRKESPEITINLSTEENLENLEEVVNEARDIMSGVFFSRDLVNERAEYLYPETLANIASKELSALGVEVEVYDEKQCEELGLKGLLAVGRGSDRKPRFIVMKYLNNPEESEVVGLVGKGVTYDSGGYSIKPTANSMDIMHCDMGGAGTVIGTMKLVATRKLKTNVIAVVGACENMIAGGSYKPGDVISTLSGKTVEVLNTDAEGRLVLCDTLTYVERFEPEAVIDIATLTGACMIALGTHNSGLMSTHHPLAHELLNAASESDDKAWQLPLGEEYQAQLKSNFADLANIGGRLGGAITAGQFLSNFTQKYHWAHLDIAGTAWKSGAEKGATGRPVPLLTQYLINKSHSA